MHITPNCIQAFGKYDKDKSGAIDVNEFDAMCKAILPCPVFSSHT